MKNVSKIILPVTIGIILSGCSANQNDELANTSRTISYETLPFGHHAQLVSGSADTMQVVTSRTWDENSEISSIDTTTFSFKSGTIKVRGVCYEGEDVILENKKNKYGLSLINWNSNWAQTFCPSEMSMP